MDQIVIEYRERTSWQCQHKRARIVAQKSKRTEVLSSGAARVIGICYHMYPNPKNVIEATFAKLGPRQSKHLFEQMRRVETLAPRLTRSKALAYTLATVIHLISLSFLLLGLWLIVDFWPLITAIAGGIFLLLVAVVARPRCRSQSATG